MGKRGGEKDVFELRDHQLHKDGEINTENFVSVNKACT